MRIAILASMLLALVLAACGGGTTEPASSPSNSPSPSAPTASPEASATTSMPGISGMSSPDTSMGHMGASSTEMGTLDDQQFIAMMIPHHQMAIDMAKVALERAEHPEIKQAAQDIIAAQQREIDQMTGWQHEWFGDATPSMSAPLTGSQMGMDMDINALKTAEPFDKAFIDGMIPHHEGAITMAKAVLATTQRPEIKDVANQIITAQEGEISQMREWRTAWYGQ